MDKTTGNTQENEDAEEKLRAAIAKHGKDPLKEGQEDEKGHADDKQTPPDLTDKGKGQAAGGSGTSNEGQSPDEPPAVENDPNAVEQLVSRLRAEGMPEHEAAQFARNYFKEENALRLQEQQYLEEMERNRAAGESQQRPSFLNALMGAKNRFNSTIDKKQLDAQREALHQSIHDRFGSLRVDQWKRMYEETATLQGNLEKKITYFNSIFEKSEKGKDFLDKLEDIAPDRAKKREVWSKIADTSEQSPDITEARNLLNQAMVVPEVKQAYEEMHAVKDDMLKSAAATVAFQEKAVLDFPDHFDADKVKILVKGNPAHNLPEPVAETPEKIKADDTVAEKIKEFMDEFINRIASMFGMAKGPKNSA